MKVYGITRYVRYESGGVLDIYSTFELALTRLRNEYQLQIEKEQVNPDNIIWDEDKAGFEVDQDVSYNIIAYEVIDK